MAERLDMQRRGARHADLLALEVGEGADRLVREHHVRIRAVDDQRLDALVGAEVGEALADRGITRLMVEAGPRLTTALLAADLIDEVALFRSPNAIGNDGIDVLEGLPLSALVASPQLRCAGSESIGPDLLETYERA